MSAAECMVDRVGLGTGYAARFPSALLLCGVSEALQKLVFRVRSVML